MTPQEELDSIYIRIGSNEPFTDDMQNRINELENIINPPREECIDENEPKGCGCSDPAHCWDCAAIRGGCPEDA